MTIIKHTTAPADGPESDVEYDEYGDAMNVAQRFACLVRWFASAVASATAARTASARTRGRARSPRA